MRYGDIDNPNIIDTTCEVVHDKFIDDYTKLLLHLDNGVVDSAKNATVTNNNVTFSTTSKFGGYSGYFNESSAYMTIPNSDNWNMSNVDFTIDFWVRCNSGSGATQYVVAHFNDGNVNDGWGVSIAGGHARLTYAASNILEGTTDLRDDTWHHIAIVRSGTKNMIFVDGSLENTAYKDFVITHPSTVLMIGRCYPSFSLYYLGGYIDELRISKGIARWTANFTPPTQSYDCPLDTQTKLLIHGGGISNFFYDNSTTARTLTPVGDTVYDTSQYKFRVSSIYFDGSGDYITAPDSADWYFGTDNFTLDLWVRFNSSSGRQTLMSQGTSGTNYWYLYYNWSTNTLGFELFNTTPIIQVTGSDTLSVGTWYHIALVRSGTSWYLFRNGTQIATATDSDAVADYTSALTIGIKNYGTGFEEPFTGWLDEIRVSKGIARWVSNFTPPTAPYDSPLAIYVVDGLDGDTDKEYRLITQTVNSKSTAANSSYFFNQDTSNSNYGLQYMYGSGASATAIRTTQIPRCGYVAAAVGSMALADTVIYAKSGKVRTMITKMTDDIQGTTVAGMSSWGQDWNNTTDNITAISWWANFGVGSRMILLKKRQLTTGTKTGEIQPVGRTYGHWQKIYDNTLTAAKTNLMLSSQMDSYTKLLIHADGADASTAFYDFSNSAHAITAVGTAQVDTAQSKFGGASLLLDGNSDYLTIPNSSDWQFGSGDFTVDCWARFNNLPTAGNYQCIAGVWDAGSSQRGWLLYVNNNAGTYQFTFYYSTTGVDNPSIVFTPWSGAAANQWYHISLVRSGNNLTVYVNGTQVGSTGSLSAILWNSTAALWIGDAQATSWYIDGWLDELRISKGIARWTANFTPPTRAYNELDGDRDVKYKLITRFVNGYAGSLTYYLRLNNDTGSNYGSQDIAGQSTSVGAVRLGPITNIVYTWINTAANRLAFADCLLYAKSGQGRIGLISGAQDINGTAVDHLRQAGFSWNNVTDKLTLIVVYANQTNGLGIGTHVELWRLNL